MIDSDGTLWSWGSNGKGRLGDGTKENKSTPVRVQPKTEAGAFIDNTTKWKAVAAGYAHTVGIDIDGTLWSWGGNGKGQLGDGTTTDKSTPVRVQKKTEEGTFVDNRTKWKAVATGKYHTVGIEEDGTLWSWGYNGSGQLGDGTAGLTANKSTPVRVQKINNRTKWKAVATGEDHTVGIDIDGTLWSWGKNASGQLGDGTTTDKSTPVRVQQKTEEGAFEDNTTKWELVAAGGGHAVGIAEDGTLWSWGENGSGQLGDGTTANKSTPVRVQQKTEAGAFEDNTTKWKTVSAGAEGGHTVGIAEDGTLWSWGWNGSGQLGDGTVGGATNKSTPVRVQQKTEAGAFVDNITKWKAVSAGRTHTVGLAEDGSLWSWGLNGSGQLGDGTRIDKNTPVKIQIPKK